MKQSKKILARCQLLNNRLLTYYPLNYSNLSTSNKPKYTELIGEITPLIDDIDLVLNRNVDINMGLGMIRELQSSLRKFNGIYEKLKGKPRVKI